MIHRYKVPKFGCVQEEIRSKRRSERRDQIDAERLARKLARSIKQLPPDARQRVEELLRGTAMQHAPIDG
jgi:hypothetical protein